MEKYIIPALVANSATLGVHWIYNHEYLLELSKKQSLLFMKPTKERFDQAKPSFYVYPNSQVGDVSVQGEILKWLYKALKENPEFTPEDYSKLLYSEFKAGGDYCGYVESYAKEHVFKLLAKELRQKISPAQAMDQQLIILFPILFVKN